MYGPRAYWLPVTRNVIIISYPRQGEEWLQKKKKYSYRAILKEVKYITLCKERPSDNTIEKCSGSDGVCAIWSTRSDGVSEACDQSRWSERRWLQSSECQVEGHMGRYQQGIFCQQILSWHRMLRTANEASAPLLPKSRVISQNFIHKLFLAIQAIKRCEGWFSAVSIVFWCSALMIRFFKSTMDNRGLHSISLVNSVPCTWSRNWHCLTILMDITSDAARDLKAWVLRDFESPLYTLSRNDSLLQRSLAHIDGQFRTKRGMLLAVYFDSFRVRFPISDWNDLQAWQVKMSSESMTQSHTLALGLCRLQ